MERVYEESLQSPGSYRWIYQAAIAGAFNIRFSEMLEMNRCTSDREVI
ncbi:MAG: hypothetical protein JXB42_02510 [Deltaproteobacteria bacterium]|nr:hypothetical protein [Deltaproteobacteria bacterium]